MAVSVGEICGTGDDADGEHGSDGRGSVRSAMDGEAPAGEWRLVSARSGLPDSAETDADRGAGHAVFLFHNTVPGNFVHTGNLYRRDIRRGVADDAYGGPESHDDEIFQGGFLPVAQFRKFQCDGGRGARAGSGGETRLGGHRIRATVLRLGTVRGGGGVFTQEPEMKKGKFAGWLLVPVLVAGFVAVWQLQKRIDGEQRATRVEVDELTIRSGSMMKRMSLEYAPLMGAIYWTRAVQYYGEKHQLHAPGLDLLWPLLDITTTLDPNLL